jgi:hypothetical protein
VTDPRDATTRSTRLAANAAAFAVLAWGVLYVVTTQVPSVRAASPFADDPWDIVVSYAAIFVPLVAGATFIRSLRHRGPHLQPATARRIRSGVTIALATIGANVATDTIAILFVPAPGSSGLQPLFTALVAVTGATTILAGWLLVRAIGQAEPATRDASEPDLLDDLLGLAGEIPGIARLIRPLERFVATSAASPRRHRLMYGLAVAVLAGLAFDVWHAIREGPWVSLPVIVLFATLVGGGVFVIYAVTLVPLRLIRPTT